MGELFDKIYKNKIIGRIFPTLNHCLKKELVGCSTVLDLGCGPSSPIKEVKNIKHSVGVDAFKPYIDTAKEAGIHNEYIHSTLEELDFEENSFDAVVLIEVIEHLSKEDALKVMEKCEKWAKSKIIITTPNGFVDQKSLDGNKLQNHLSGWTVKELNNLGYVAKGLAGLKWLHQESEHDTMTDSILSTMRFKPQIVCFLATTFSQMFTYYFPKVAFELFCTRNLNE